MHAYSYIPGLLPVVVLALVLNGGVRPSAQGRPKRFYFLLALANVW